MCLTPPPATTSGSTTGISRWHLHRRWLPDRRGDHRPRDRLALVQTPKPPRLPTAVNTSKPHSSPSSTAASAYGAIKKCWPTTKIQRCPRPRPTRGPPPYHQPTHRCRAHHLPTCAESGRITTLDEAAAWGVQLHEFSTIYREWMNEKTMIKDPKTGAWTRVWTHHNVRRPTTASTIFGGPRCCLSTSTRQQVPCARADQIHHQQLKKAASTPSSNCSPEPTAADQAN